MKEAIKRAFRWILHGVPKVNITKKLYTLSSGEQLNGKKILITGGSSGLGFAIAQKFLEEGAAIIITGRNEQKLKTASAQLKDCPYCVFDNKDIDKIPILNEAIENSLGYLDGVVCNAGISLHEGMFYNVTPDTWDKQFDVNLRGNYFLLQDLIKNRHKDIDFNVVIISSERGAQCDDIPYGLTKVALNSLTRGLSRRFYKEHVRVNAIAPGITASDMTEVDRNGNLYQPLISSDRYFVPEEVAEVALFLMSDRSKCVSGEVIATDAGNYISSYY